MARMIDPVNDPLMDGAPGIAGEDTLDEILPQTHELEDQLNSLNLDELTGDVSDREADDGMMDDYVEESFDDNAGEPEPLVLNGEPFDTNVRMDLAEDDTGTFDEIMVQDAVTHAAEEEEKKYRAMLALVAVQGNDELLNRTAEELGSKKTYKELITDVLGSMYADSDLPSSLIGENYMRLFVQSQGEPYLKAFSRFAHARGIDIMDVDDFIVNKLKKSLTELRGHYEAIKTIYDEDERSKWRVRYEENKPSSEELKADFLRRKEAEEKEDHTMRDAVLLSAGLASGTVAVLFSLYALVRSMYRGWSFTRWASLAVILLLGVAVAAGHELSLWELFTLPYGFYIFLRLAVALLSAWLAYVAVVRKKSPVLVLFSVLLALLYQPLVKIALDAVVWQWVNMASIPVLFLLAIFITRHEHKTP